MACPRDVRKVRIMVKRGLERAAKKGHGGDIPKGFERKPAVRVKIYTSYLAEKRRAYFEHSYNLSRGPFVRRRSN